MSNNIPSDRPPTEPRSYDVVLGSSRPNQSLPSDCISEPRPDSAVLGGQQSQTQISTSYGNTNTMNGRRFNSKALATRGGRTPFETRLIESGHATTEQFDRALRRSQDSGASLINCLQEILGASLAPDVVRHYKRYRLFESQILYGVAAIDLDIESELSNIDNIHDLIETVIPMSICRIHELVPLQQSDTFVMIGMVNPTDFRARDELTRLAASTNSNFYYRVLLKEDFDQIFEQVIDFAISQRTQLEEINNTDDPSLLAGYEPLEYSDSEADITQLLTRTPVPIAKLVDRILTLALEQQVSEIILEPQSNYASIRLRVGDRLQELQTSLPAQLANALANRFKLLANLDITKRQTPQIGKSHRIFKNRRVSFQIRTMPCANGENITIRVLDPARLRSNLVWLKQEPSIYTNLERLCDRTSGLTLVVGGANSGISTTLYALLERYSELARTIFTIENPVELPLSRIAVSQVEVCGTQDITNAIRSVQQQNAEVIAVSAIESPEIAEVIFDAAASSAILSSLPVEHSITALSQLLSMGIPATMLSTRLNSIIYQKSLRRVCIACRIPYRPAVTELERSGFTDNATSHTFYRAQVANPSSTSRGRICHRCKGTGYKGIIVAAEIMPIDENLRRAIERGTSPTSIRQMAISGGMTTLLESVQNLAWQGHITLEEVARFISSNPLLEHEREVRLGRFVPIQEEPATATRPTNQELDLALAGILETLDLFDYANQQTQPQTQREITINSSYQRLREHLLQVLRRAGVTPMETIGQPFNPVYHECIATRPAILHSANTVVAELRRGYMLGERVLRHARVEVAVIST